MHRNKKITFVIASLGGERVLSNLANYFSSKGVKINIPWHLIVNLLMS